MRYIAAAILALLALACHASSDASDAAPHKLGGGVAIPIYETLSGFGPDASSSTLIGPSVSGLDRVNQITVDCSITSGTGDASVPLDVYLQKQSSNGVWIDYIHFPKQTISLSSATVTYDVASGLVAATPILVGVGDASTAGVALDAGLVAFGYPGGTLRLVVVTGAGTIYTPASVACYFYGRTNGP